MSKKSKIRKQSCPNTSPAHRPHPNVGDKVYVIRHEHGWEDGRFEGTVSYVSCCQPNGGTRYTVIGRRRDDPPGEYPVYCNSLGDVQCL